MTKVLIIEARFYDDIHDMMLEGAKATFDKHNVEYDIITIRGALEIPAVVKMAHQSKKYNYDGYLCLGCVIRGETTHYDYVCQESCRGIMDLSLEHDIAIANGILTVENKDQAIARADIKQKNKGGFCADVVLDMITLKNKFKG
ncbi:MAG: 6,7-dimethyl-8-ribityllumazine synthase [Alphaproteobacteria bacterium]